MENVLKKSLVDQSDFLFQFPFTADQLANVRAIGRALHEECGIGAGKHGEIVVTIDDTNAKEIDYAEWSEERARGSTAGSRERRQRAQAAGHPPSAVSSSRRAYYRAEVAILRSQYPGTYFRMDDSGQWVVVPAFPLGMLGPQLCLIVAVPDDPNIRISSWAFWTSDQHCSWVGHRHTNYPDGSVCAFPPDGSAWKDGDPLVGYIDRLCEWSVRHVFHWLETYWPGPQGAMCRYYHIKEGRPREKCFCHSGKSYFECCRPLDLVQSCQRDRDEFLENCKGLDVGQQHPAKQLYDFALGTRPKLPKMKKVHPWFA